MALSVLSWPPTPPISASHLMVMLHGFGSNAQDLLGLAPAFELPTYRFQLINAPFPHPQMPGGSMWYDLFDAAYTGVTESRQRLLEYLQALPEQTGIPLERTILAGFSQGGAMTLDVGLRLPLAGLVVFSGYLHPLDGDARQEWPPILMVHGRQDAVVALEMAQQAVQDLTAAGAQLDYHELDMGHEINPEAVHLAQQWLEALTRAT